MWGVEEAWLFPNLHVSRSSHSPHHRATHAWWCDFLHVRICRCRPGDGMQCDARVRQGIARLSRPRKREERSAFEGLLGSIKRYLLGALGSFGIAELGLDLPFDSEL